MKEITLMIVQPVLASYRKYFFDQLTEYFNKVSIYANLCQSDGFAEDVSGKFIKIHTPVIGVRNKIYYQTGVVRGFLKNRPTVLLLTADFRAVHFWILLVLAKILKIPAFPHGQGLYDKPCPGLLYRALYFIVEKLCSQYICYAPSVCDTLIDIGFSSDKLSIMENTVFNPYTIRPEDKCYNSPCILYIGRLRKGSGLQVLFDAVKLINENGYNLNINLIGDGELRSQLESYAGNMDIDVNFYGAVYDEKKIADLSKNCAFGVYPGDAGLSVVHYMSLSLVPVVHDELSSHMGPEPSYVVSGVNGLAFSRGSAESLARVIEEYLDNDNKIRELSENAFETYCSLGKPDMASKFYRIVQPYIAKNID